MDQIRKQVARARRRLWMELLLNRLVNCWFAALIVAALAIALPKFLRRRTPLIRASPAWRALITSQVLSVLPSSIPVLVLVLGILDSTRVFRLSRAVAADINVMDFVEAAKLRGEKTPWIVFSEILPNALTPLISELGLRFIFAVLFLDSQHRLISDEILFKGTINSTAVYPRIVVQRALLLNAAALILYHNHPSGEPEPSTADRHITTQLTESLKLIDVRVIDHLVVAGSATVSFAERSWL